MSTRTKEKGLRQKVKDCVNSLISAGHPVHLTWIESHATALGAPDLSYCCYGVEGWIELKAGPDIEVRAAQVRWIKDHIESGGWPLLLVQWQECFLLVPGSRASSLRADPSEENILRCASSRWYQVLPDREFLRVMRNPRKEYEKLERDID